MRIISLVPSVTETLLEWGVEPVACTRFCEQPGLAHVGGTKNPDLEAILALRPDLVVMEREENRREDYDALCGSGVEVLALSVRGVEDVATALTALAARVGVTWTTPTATPARPLRRTAFVPIWRRPYMALGTPTYATSMLSRLGVANVYTDADGPYPSVTLEEAAARRPDVVLAPSEPYPFADRHRPELESVAPCVFVDGQDLFWWGTRTAGAAQRLGEILDALA